MSKAILHTDGGARPTNPGHAGFACVVSVDGKKHELSRYIGWATNNHAEYTALIVGVKMARNLNATQIEIYSDSKLVVNQVLDKWACKDPKIRELCYRAQKTLNDLFPDSWSIHWVKRDMNVVADDLCTQAIKYGMSMNLFTGKATDGSIVDANQSASSARRVKFLAAAARRAQSSS